MYKPLPECLTISKSFIDGLGLFAAEDILIETDFGISHIKDPRFEDSYIRTPLGGFFNHSDDPNSKIIKEGDYLRLVAINDIKAGEEITAKYTLTVADKPKKLYPNDPIEW